MIVRQARAGNREARATHRDVRALARTICGRHGAHFPRDRRVSISPAAWPAALGPLFDARLFRAAFERHPPYEPIVEDDSVGADHLRGTRTDRLRRSGGATDARMSVVIYTLRRGYRSRQPHLRQRLDVALRRLRVEAAQHHARDAARLARQLRHDRADSDPRGAIGRKTVDAGRDRRESNAGEPVSRGNLQRAPVAGGEQRILIVFAIVPDRPDRMNDVPRGETDSRRVIFASPVSHPPRRPAFGHSARGRRAVKDRHPQTAAARKQCAFAALTMASTSSVVMSPMRSSSCAAPTVDGEERSGRHVGIVRHGRPGLIPLNMTGCVPADARISRNHRLLRATPRFPSPDRASNGVRYRQNAGPGNAAPLCGRRDAAAAKKSKSVLSRDPFRACSSPSSRMRCTLMPACVAAGRGRHIPARAIPPQARMKTKSR